VDSKRRLFSLRHLIPESSAASAARNAARPHPAPQSAAGAVSPTATGDSSRTDQATADWHCLPAEEVLDLFGTSNERGLAASEAEDRLRRFGSNEIRQQARRSPLRMLASQFTDFMIVVLIVAAAISALIGEAEDSIVIVVIVVLNAVVGFVQEYRAERAIAALKRLAASGARAIRNGDVVEVRAVDLVPGDIVLLEAGNVLPADGRLLDCAAFTVDEAALTGESVPIDKTVAAIADRGASLGDRRNMVYKGTTVVHGRARAAVVATGMQTELGKIALLLAGDAENKTPLQKRLAHFGKRVAIACLVVCAAIFAIGVARGEPLALMFLVAVSLAVAAIPEALPAVVTTALAMGAYRMVRKNALIRRLPAVETLGSVTRICSDKTGTLTENKMRVEQIVVDGRIRSLSEPDATETQAQRLLFVAIALDNDASCGAGGEIGDPTELALLRAAKASGYDKAKLEADMPRIAELPFDADRKCMTTAHRSDGRVVAFTKGAPERLLERCNSILVGDETRPIDRDGVLDEAERLAANGLRVIGVAWRLHESPDAPSLESIERELTFVGLVAMIDPPRAEAAEAVALCRSAGITPVMVTGDHPATARAIAQRLGIVGPTGRVVTGSELERLSPEELKNQAKSISVFARVSPSQKIAIVEALQASGECVAMTGDGVNDAPALKRADIGVAMGRTGTDVAREASAMTLLDDNFATIVAAVREGRRIYDNIRKFVRFVMGGNSGEIWTIAAAPMFGLPLPLLPIQILWVNLVTDGLPGLALAAEREEKDVMRRPPRPAGESIFAHGMWQHIVWVGILIGAICLSIQAWAVARGSEHWQTMVFTALAFCQMYHVLAIRYERESTLLHGVFSNWLLNGAVALTVLSQLALIYVPALNPIFDTDPLTWDELAISTLLPALVFVGVELEKWMVRKGWIYRAALESIGSDPRRARSTSG
jgi:Ca2+-transporting ATPase